MKKAFIRDLLIKGLLVVLVMTSIHCGGENPPQDGGDARDGEDAIEDRNDANNDSANDRDTDTSGGNNDAADDVDTANDTNQPTAPVGEPIEQPDSAFPLTRLTNLGESGGFGTHIYSQLQAFSRTNQYVLLIENGEYVVRRLNGLENLNINTASWNAPRWHPIRESLIVHYDSNEDETIRVQYTDVVNRTTTTVYTFPAQYQRIRPNPSFDELSHDGRWMTGMVTRGQDNVIFSLDLETARLGATLVLSTLYNGPCALDPQYGIIEPDWTAPSPLGRYLVVQWPRDGTERCSGLETFNIASGVFTGRVNDGHQHGDLGVGTNGTTEFFMGYTVTHPTSPNGIGVEMRALPGTNTVSQPESLMTIPGIGGHISCQGPHGVCLVSTFDGDVGVSDGDLVLQYTDDTTQMIGRHRSTGCGYWVQPRASLSRDGRFAIFASDWGVERGCGEDDLGAGDAYLIDLGTTLRN